MAFKYKQPSIKIGGTTIRKNKKGYSFTSKTLLGGTKTYNTGTGKTTKTYKTGIKGLSYQTVSGGSKTKRTNSSYKQQSVSNKSVGSSSFKELNNELQQIVTRSSGGSQSFSNYHIENDSYDEMIKDIKKAKNIHTIWIIFLVASFLLIGVHENFIILFFAVLCIRLFRSLFNVKVNYNLSDDIKTEWQMFLDSMQLLDNGGHNFISESRSSTGLAMKAKRVTGLSSNKARIKSNVDLFKLSYGKNEILFLPNIVVYSSKPSIISYEDINTFSSHTSQNMSKITNDMTVLRYRYAHQNKDGSRDLRYKQNPIVSGLVRFGEINAILPTRQSISILMTRYDDVEIIANSFKSYADFISKNMDEFDTNRIEDVDAESLFAGNESVFTEANDIEENVSELQVAKIALPAEENTTPMELDKKAILIDNTSSENDKAISETQNDDSLEIIEDKPEEESDMPLSDNPLINELNKSMKVGNKNE